MIIDIISPFDEVPMQDYQVAVLWDSLNESWRYDVLELSPHGEIRVMDRIYNYTGFLGENQKSIELYINLNQLVYPDKYSVFFVAEHFFPSGIRFDICRLIDVSDGHAYVPAPQFVLSISQNALNLRPGEEKDIEVKVNSTSQIDSQITLFTDQIKDMDSDFTRTEMLLPADSFITSTLRIKAHDNANESIYTLPVSANITFPFEQNDQNEKITNSLSLAADSTPLTNGSRIGGYSRGNTTSEGGWGTTLVSNGSGIGGGYGGGTSGSGSLGTLLEGLLDGADLAAGSNPLINETEQRSDEYDPENTVP